jgi:ribosomal protein S18 acetylase RimI-like enzyme
LLDWLEARGAEVLRAVVAAHPGRPPAVLRLGCPDQHPERASLYQQRGFRPVRHFYRMRRDLRQPIPDRPLPAGLRFDHYRPENGEALRQALNEAFSDHWSPEPVSENDWQQFIVQQKSFRPELTQVVMDGSEVAAFSLNGADPQPGPDGERPGWIGSLGTRRPWRKRGLASALLVESMRLFQAAGLDSAMLGVDSQNPSGALGLYERLGFVTFRSSTAFHKEVQPAGEPH